MIQSSKFYKDNFIQLNVLFRVLIHIVRALNTKRYVDAIVLLIELLFNMLRTF
ncbi:hypothetical protein PLUTE_b0505 [Pseudoalteromonas luteoviolacea DSM 6061]|nr:hypothetical protein [Pseudoalteromonas luteoviolacea DSM 6061]